MTSSNWIKLIIAAGIGITLGIVYGWVIDPVEYVDAPPGILRNDYKADYVLMVAEAYHGDFNSETAARRLGLLGSEPPSQIVSDTLDFARANSFNTEEIALLQDLLSAMLTYQPQEIDAP